MSPHQRNDNTPDVGLAAARDLLTADLTVIGQFLNASNGVLLVWLGEDPPTPGVDLANLDPARLAVLKPASLETLLDDYPHHTLYRREVASSRLSTLLGWGLVPATVVRKDTPFGVASLQAFVPHDRDHHFVWLRDQQDPVIDAQLRRMVAFDLVAEHADRKASHVLWDAQHRQIRLIDNGLTFSLHENLRTVAWEWAGAPIDPDIRLDVEQAATALRDDPSMFEDLLTEREAARLLERMDRLSELATFPLLPNDRRAIPWPPI